MRKKLIEVALPLEAINAASAREKSIRHGHPSTLHLWWARRPLAAARAVLFAQLVDDPSSWPEMFPTEEAQNQERQRLFRLIEDLVPWENSNNETVINAARLEIARSHARASSSLKAKGVLAEGVKPEVVNAYLATELPPVHDPFAGGGTIPLEAQRLGLRAIATDLNPVAVMINKALVEAPPKFAAMPPVNPEARANAKLRTWKGAEGLAADVRYYGAWMREEAKKRIGQLYPDVDLPKEQGGGKATVIAWLWARTVPSPNPSARGAKVPLVASFWLAQKEGKEAWVEVKPNLKDLTYRFLVRDGKPGDPAKVSQGTKLGSGNFRCALTGDPIPAEYTREQGQAGRLGARMMAVVALGDRRRLYIAPDAHQERVADIAPPEDAPDTALPAQALGFRVQNYGMTHHRDLFSPRQLTFLTTMADLVGDAREQAKRDALSAKHTAGRTDERSLEEGGVGADAYADAVALGLACALGRAADFGATLCVWSPAPKNEVAMHVFGRQTLSMTWDYAEINPFSNSSGNWLGAVDWSAKAIEMLQGTAPAKAYQADAAVADESLGARIFSTDPPYYDNVPYADLSDFFYIWSRRALHRRFPEMCRTVLVPKADELIAEPFRHGSKEKADSFFLDGMRRVLARLSHDSAEYPATLYYAFKQSESDDGGSSSTGWEAFLDAVVGAGFCIDGTLPVRTERPGRLRDTGSNALASSIVLVCQRRAPDAPSTTRGEFRRLLRRELPDALKQLQQGNIAPVDVAQASIGPGIGIFSRHRLVAEADGSPMTVRSALQLINEVLDEYLASGEGDFDADTRFAITWYEQHGWDTGPFGEAETLAKARNVSVKGVEVAGICHTAAGKVRILKRHELRPLDYDPAADTTPTVWEFTQHMIRYLEEEGEERAARLLRQLGSRADATRELAYRLYNTCERKKWAEDARAYNGLILAWPELEKLAARMTDEAPAAAPSKTAKKGKKTKTPTKGQQALFEGDDE